ncbi:MAG: transposase [Phycisphaeraceae bacterium]|nr:transposase [Phycisphaeraceae bacterium]
MDVASLVSAWDAMILQLAVSFTSPTARTWRQITLGWVLPVLFALYRKPGDCNRQHPFRTRQQLAAQMVQKAVKTLPHVHWRVAADGQYATRDMVEGLPDSVTLVSRIRSNAAIYDLPQPRRKSQRGRPAKKGKRLPTPRAVARRRQEGWTR